MNVNEKFSETDLSDFPVSTYAATKKSNELMAHTYSHIYNIPTTGLDFSLFTDLLVDQIWLILNSESNLRGNVIDVYNEGNQSETTI